MARVVKPPMFCDRLIEACRYEYRTRNLIDGRIVQCDQRISIVAGYLTDEVSGLSPFTFIHRDDVRWVMVALRQSKFEFLCVFFPFHSFSLCRKNSQHLCILSNVYRVCLLFTHTSCCSVYHFSSLLNEL